MTVEPLHPGDADLAGFAATPRWITAWSEKEETPSLDAAPAAWLDAVDPPDDLYDPENPHPPRFLGAEDWYDDLPPMSRVDGLEWELWAGVDQDEAEREMLRLKAPAWVFLPPGAELAAALESVRPQCESPIALIELMKAASRMVSWLESIKADAMASFVRQRKAQATEIPRPTHIDSSGRPIDPERSWAAEIGAALHLSTNTAARHIDTALHLTGTLTATHTALRCGALTWSKALSISEATRHLPDATAQAVESHVLRRAASQTHTNLRKSLRRQVAKHCAADETNRHREAVRDRTCKIVPLPDGMAGLWVVHTADKIQQMWVVIQAMADLAKRGTPTTTTPARSETPCAETARAEPSSPKPSTAEPSPPVAPSRVEPPPVEPPPVEPSRVEPSPVGSDIVASGNRYSGRSSGRTPDPASGVTPEVKAGTAAGAKCDTTADMQPNTATGATVGEPMRDDRTAEQRRADAITDVFEHMLHNGLDWLGRRLPDQHRRRPHIEILVPITTLLGVDNDPCELTGYGPIPAPMARRIARDGTWRRLLTDPTNGTVLEASTTRHNPGPIVTETLLARHPVCAWPGCNRTSRQCDRDHATPFKQSGHTNLTGLVPYCEYHHVIKDTPTWGWKTTTHPDGSLTLTTPTGHRYTTVPPARGPITQEQDTPDPPPF
ncbi:uncharacterized protein DUF222 [Kribbella sp. VKM Ac-2571]|uniref:HNH endonuclease signature motif containing protein n=1 Tax=Kribbella sp. VKM Ac-2571 TaxID=2512222 RepID=UPI0010D42EA9|nr:HNH endonuclease signature motif containing protein [Kribbella sp. VKM Ac-2571]TDO52961.1 uncharacterized protein DUF222 [Kribbella sp. VKM Ac-2571]